MLVAIGLDCEGAISGLAAAAVFAGAQRAVQSGIIHSDERVVLLATGNGLKDVKRAQTSVSGGLRVKPDLDSIQQALRRGLN